MLREVTKTIGRPPSVTREIAAEYQLVRDLIDGNPAAMDRANLGPEDRMVIALWNRWLPWERKRAQWILANVTQSALWRWSQREVDAARGAPIPTENATSRRFVRAPIRLGPTALALDGYLNRYGQLWNDSWPARPDDFVREITARRAVQLMLAIGAWRLEHGQFPESLDGLVGPYLERMPVDPSTGEPFGYFPQGLSTPVSRFGDDPHPVAAKTPLLSGSALNLSLGYPLGQDGRRIDTSRVRRDEEPDPEHTWFVNQVFPLPTPQDKPAAKGSPETRK